MGHRRTGMLPVPVNSFRECVPSRCFLVSCSVAVFLFSFCEKKRRAVASKRRWAPNKRNTLLSWSLQHFQAQRNEETAGAVPATTGSRSRHHLFQSPRFCPSRKDCSFCFFRLSFLILLCERRMFPFALWLYFRRLSKNVGSNLSNRQQLKWECQWSQSQTDKGK